MKRPAIKRERTTCKHCGNTNAELVMAHVTVATDVVGRLAIRAY